ncbi:MAG: DNA polymerase III subunit chi [Holosporaceae bacterium]|jgi:DNA polymerase-3 subunit chi|nr:DNA polymerase III subunit chi [Holosporaceae bacterium]
MEISLYHVMTGGLIPAIIRLLEKIYLAKQRCVFFSPLEERIASVDKMLWTFSTNAFIPHGDKNLGFCHRQPIYLTDKFENPNNAQVAVIVDTLDYKDYDNFEKVFIIFEEEEQGRGALLYSDLRNNEKNVIYWKQSTRGWEKVV